jgi:hypothetical protein
MAGDLSKHPSLSTVEDIQSENVDLETDLGPRFSSYFSADFDRVVEFELYSLEGIGTSDALDDAAAILEDHKRGFRQSA